LDFNFVDFEEIETALSAFVADDFAISAHIAHGSFPLCSLHKPRKDTKNKTCWRFYTDI